MKYFLVCILVLGLVIGLAGAEQVNPTTDVLTRWDDGAYVVIFGNPDFPSPVTIVNGVALIGGITDRFINLS